MIRPVVVGVICALSLVMLYRPVVRAQGGGASQTGTIDGRVTDAQGAAIAGVTVTSTSPSQMGAHAAVTNDEGVYRFTAVAPGTYTLQYERTGFTVLTRAGIDVALGFTATVHVNLTLASVQARVSVLGTSPTIDTSTGRVQANFTRTHLDSLPNARDMWSLLAVTPGVQMGRWDIGGNRSGNQTSYRAYGYGGQDQQVRILIEGINATDGRSNNGFFQDYSSFDEMLVTTAGASAETPTPGVMTQILGKSGSNAFHGELYADYENNALQGVNISSALVARGIPEHGNEIQRRVDRTVSAGGPVRHDTFWYYAGYRQLTSALDQVNLQIGRTFDTTLYNASGKGTYRLGRNHTLIGYYQWGKKKQPNRAWNAGYNFFNLADTTRQDDGSWIWKGEWNGAVSSTLFVEGRYGGFGYFFPLIGNSDEPFRQDTGTRVSSGGDRKTQTDRDRKQWTTAATYFVEDFLGVRHAVKAGAEMNLETAWTGFERTRAGNVEQIFNTGRATQVILGFPTADGEVGHRRSRNHLLSIARLDHVSGFLTDEWSISDALTVNAGVRFDRYRSHSPEQRQLAFTNGPIALPAATFSPQTYFTWSSIVPRLGVVYNIDGEGKTVAKVNYGYFNHNPSFDIAMAANANQGTKSITYAWTDRSGDRLYQPGEEGAIVSSNLAGAVSFDPGITQPHSHEVSTFVERELGAGTSVRAGYVYKTNDALWQPYRPYRPIDAYATPFSVRDAGVDGSSGTSDDRDLTFYGTPNAQLGPATTVIRNVPAFGRYKAVEASFARRLRGRWALGGGFSYSWTHEHNNNYIGNNISPSSNPGYPNSPNEALYANGEDGAHRFTIWDVKAHGTWEAPLGIRVSPVLRVQAGQPYGRVLQVTAPASCACFFNGMVLVEPFDARRMDNVAVFDVRAETTVPIAGRSRARLFVDVFNAFNSGAFDVISFTTGPAFELPTSIIAPRLARVGVRLSW